jgi:hypothetical protein
LQVAVQIEDCLKAPPSGSIPKQGHSLVGALLASPSGTYFAKASIAQLTTQQIAAMTDGELGRVIWSVEVCPNIEKRSKG